MIGLLFMMLMLAAPEIGSAEEEDRRPNIVIILADDLGWRDVSSNGSQFYETPHIDSLAKRGVKFPNAYAAPVCSPSRAALMTGLHPARLRFTAPSGHVEQVILEHEAKVPDTGHPTFKVVMPDSVTRLPNHYVTIAELLRNNGYRTGLFGKWHLGRKPYIPEKQGFDFVIGGRFHPGPPPPGYFAPWKIETIPEQIDGEHISDRLALEASKFIRQNRTRRFALFFWDYSIHSPWEAKASLIAKYKKKVKNLSPEYPQRNPIVGAMVESHDRAVGKVLRALKDNRIQHNTIIIYLSDNGGVTYAKPGGVVATSNSPLRNGKASLYEGGIRVPSVVVWPGRATGDTTNEELITVTDFFPTILEMANIELPGGYPNDGVSLVNTLAESTPINRGDGIYTHYPHYIPVTGHRPGTAIRLGSWKLIRYYHDGKDFRHRHELYHLDTDPGETKDLSALEPEIVQGLSVRMNAFLKRTNTLIPKINPNYDPIIEISGGWGPSEHAKLSLEEGLLKLKSVGGDPFIFNEQIPLVASKQLRVVFRMRSGSKGKGLVFWATVHKPQFSQHKPFTPIHDGKFHSYEISFQVDSPLIHFRIDPSESEGLIHFDHIEIQTKEGKTVKHWDWEEK